MPIKLMYITNQPEVAKIAEKAGVDRVFVDLEIIGKLERQGHLDTVISRHSIADIAPIKDCIKSAELLVRSNPYTAGPEKKSMRLLKTARTLSCCRFLKRWRNRRNL